MNNITKLKLVYFFKSLFFFAPIITLFYLSRNLDLFQIVSLEAALIISVLVMEVPTGMLADKIGRKWSLVFHTILYITGNIIIIYSHHYYLFIFSQILFGIAIAFGSGAVEALIYDSLKEEKKESQMSKTWGLIGSYSLSGTLVAVLVGGYVARFQTKESFVTLLWLYVIGACIAFVISLFVKEKHHYKSIKRENPLILFKNSTKHILENKSLRKIIYLTVLTLPFTHILMFLFQPYFLLANVDKSVFGIAMALGMLLGILLLRYTHKIEELLGMKKTIFIVTIMPGLIYLAMSFFIGPIISFAWFVLAMGFTNMAQPLFSQYQNTHIKSHNRATVLSIISMIVALYLAVMRLVLGKVANYNILTAFIVMGVIILIGSLFFRIDERHLVKV